MAGKADMVRMRLSIGTAKTVAGEVTVAMADSGLTALTEVMADW